MYRNRFYTSRYCGYNGYRSPLGRRTAYRKAGAVAKRINKLARTVGSIKSAIEVKTVQYYMSGNVALMTQTTQAFHANSLTVLAGGTNGAQYIGTEVSWKGMLLRYGVQAGFDNVGAYPYSHNVRVMVVWIHDWQTQAASWPATNFLYLPVANADLGVIAQYNSVSKDTFEVLYDKTHYLTDKMASNTHEGATVKIPLKGKKTMYSINAPAANANIINGAIWVYVFSNVNPSGYNPPVFYALADMYYTDA